MSTPTPPTGPPPDPARDAQGFIRRSLAAHGGQLPRYIPIPDDPVTEYNVRHAIETEARGRTFTAANAILARDHPDLCRRIGLSVEDDGEGPDEALQRRWNAFMNSLSGAERRYWREFLEGMRPGVLRAEMESILGKHESGKLLRGGAR